MVKPAHPFTIKKGDPSPLGTSKKDAGINFALFSEHATGVTLCLYQKGSQVLLAEIDLDLPTHRTGSIWHIQIEGLPDESEYCYKVAGPFLPKKGHLFNPDYQLIDPYAKSLNSSINWGETKHCDFLKGRILPDLPFDWEGTTFPHLPIQDLIIYEMHVRGFTKHASSGITSPGTYLGVIEKIPHFKSLGVNAIELMPVFEFNETENPHKNPKTGEQLYNYWGYSTVNYFAPMPSFTTSPEWGAPILEFKKMVRELHKNQIEIILDVVFNHTAEGLNNKIYISFKGIDNAVYYLIGPGGNYMDFSGCGNTVDCNHPVVMQFIIDVLKYWVVEMHVDGFRFDLASIFCRDEKGVPIPDPPIIRALLGDPVLAKTKLIAEAWDAAGLYQVGTYPGGIRWSEWNGKFRDVARRFIKGTDGYAGAFATALCGSQDLYGNGRHPYNSINFITAHDGFTLRDLVSYQKKHNEENGEHNRDGSNSNDSWNCGQEGPTQDLKILQLREKQMRNFILALMVSIGVPMILMGDEYGHTRNGNNNAYCQDNEKNWFLWNALQTSKDFFRFFRFMVNFRKKTALFKRTDFLGKDEIDWHGNEPFRPHWDRKCRFLAYTLKDPSPVFIAFNAGFESVRITLPPPPPNKTWKLIVDTSLSPPHDYNEEPTPIGPAYVLHEHSSLLLQAL